MTKTTRMQSKKHTETDNPYASAPQSQPFQLRSQPLDRYPDAPAASDDATSIAAAEDAATWAPSLRTAVLRELEDSAATVHEIAERTNTPIAAIQPRFSELRARNMITPSGEKRRNKMTGKKAIVWRIQNQP